MESTIKENMTCSNKNVERIKFFELKSALEMNKQSSVTFNKSNESVLKTSFILINVIATK